LLQGRLETPEEGRDVRMGRVMLKHEIYQKLERAKIDYLQYS
jgi:hypothetical protein